MRLRESGLPMDPEVERELAAIEAGLAGLAVPPDLEELAALSRELRAGRPAPSPEFAARLDERSADGFPRVADSETGGTEAFRRMRDRLAATSPRRLIAVAGAAATLLVAVGVGISVSNEQGGTSAPVQSPPVTLPSGGTAAPAPPTVSTPGSAGEASGTAATPASPRAPGARAVPRAPGAPAESLAPRGRKVAKSADLVLSAEPSEVRGVADGVVKVTDHYHGFVVRSRVTSGQPRPAPTPLAGRGSAAQPLPSGTFELRIPAGSLQPALGDLSDLAHVTSRTESLRDITSRYNASAQAVRDLEAQRDQLLKDLADAVTPAERDSINARLHIVENQLAAARHDLARIQQRVHLVPVSVEILAQRGIDGGAGAGGGWDLGNALHDAGRVLVVTGGVLLISLAVLAPIALLAALGWLGARAVLRIRRERALD